LSAFPAKKPNALWTIIEIANPAYVAIAIVLPIAVLIFALMRGDLLPLNFVHIITGALWTGIDIFMGIALGPAIGGLDLAARTSIFKRITPKMTFLMPVIAGVASTAADSGAKLPPFRAKVATVPADGCHHSGAKLPLFEGVAE
jgi:hypothetical protein